MVGFTVTFLVAVSALALFCRLSVLLGDAQAAAEACLPGCAVQRLAWSSETAELRVRIAALELHLTSCRSTCADPSKLCENPAGSMGLREPACSTTDCSMLLTNALLPTPEAYASSLKEVTVETNATHSRSHLSADIRHKTDKYN